MTMPFEVTLLVLFSAVMHATWNALAKAGPNKLLDVTAMAVAGGVACALILPFMPLPERESWPWLAASLLLHFLYFMALVGAYNNADLSHAYPLMRGVAPLFVAVFGGLLLEERLTPAMWAGIALICAGILLPFAPGGADKQALVRSSGFALANAGIIAAYTLVDGFGTRLSANAVSYCLWLFLLDPLPILAVAVARHGDGAWRHFRMRWRVCIAGGVLTVSAYGIVLWAMTRAPVAAVAALRETSVIFAAVIGTVFLREGFGTRRIAGAVLVAGGIAALRL